MIWLAYWRQLLAGAVAVVALFTAYSAGLHRGDVKLAQAQAQHALALADAQRIAREREAQLQAALDVAEEDYNAELKSLRRKRNPGAGAPVRLCTPADTTAGRSTAAAGAATGSGETATVTGLVSGSVPQGADIGPMLRDIIEHGDQLAAQVRALQAAWPK
jgi:hypothetical protein